MLRKSVSAKMRLLNMPAFIPCPSETIKVYTTERVVISFLSNTTLVFLIVGGRGVLIKRVGVQKWGVGSLY